MLRVHCAVPETRARHHGPTSPQSCGGNSEGETPGPIPNPEVKPFSADGTARGTAWESRTPPDIHEEGRSRQGRAALFVCLGTVVADAGGWLAWLRNAERPRAEGQPGALVPAAAVLPRRPLALLPEHRRPRGGARVRPGPAAPQATAGAARLPAAAATVRNRAPAATARPAMARGVVLGRQVPTVHAGRPTVRAGHPGRRRRTGRREGRPPPAAARGPSDRRVLPHPMARAGARGRPPPMESAGPPGRRRPAPDRPPACGRRRSPRRPAARAGGSAPGHGPVVRRRPRGNRKRGATTKLWYRTPVLGQRQERGRGARASGTRAWS